MISALNKSERFVSISGRRSDALGPGLTTVIQPSSQAKDDTDQHLMQIQYAALKEFRHRSS